MRILCVIPAYWPNFKLGGPIFSVHALNKAWVKKGIEVSVYTTNVGLENKVSENKLVGIDGVKVTYFSFARAFEFLGVNGWQFSLPLSVALKENLKLFDIVYIVGIWNYPTVIAAHYCRKYKKPYVISPRGLLYPYTAANKSWKKWPYYHLALKQYIRGASLMHYTSEDEAAKCHLPLGLTNRAAVIPNGIDYESFARQDPREFLNRHPELKGKKIIIFLGRINWKKGLDILIKAYALLRQKKSDIHLLIVGEGESAYLKKVKNWVKQYKIIRNVTFTGMLTGQDKLEAYACSNIFVLPSYSENFGMAAVEAMASGLPVVISDQVGIHREVSGAGAGIVVKTDVQELSLAMGHLLADPAMCKEMGSCGKRLVYDKYRLEVVADDMIKMFNGLLSGS